MIIDAHNHPDWHGRWDIRRWLVLWSEHEQHNTLITLWQSLKWAQI